MYLLQDYTGESILLIYNNSSTKQELSNIELKSNQSIVLVNQPINPHTNDKFNSLGEIFNCILSYIRDNFDPVWVKEALVNHMHCDDAYLPNHFTNGVRGYYEGKSKGFDAYKPRKSFFLYGDSVELKENYMEPSVFLEWKLLQKVGYTSGSNAAYDMPWYEGCKMYLDDVSPTLIYCWGNGTYKISGNDVNPDNFKDARKSDTDEGDRIITPSPIESIEKIYKLVII